MVADQSQGKNRLKRHSHNSRLFKITVTRNKVIYFRQGSVGFVGVNGNAAYIVRQTESLEHENKTFQLHSFRPVTTFNLPIKQQKMTIVLNKLQRITMTFMQPVKTDNYNCNYVEYPKH